jgi:hypothetical protein
MVCEEKPPTTFRISMMIVYMPSAAVGETVPEISPVSLSMARPSGSGVDAAMK